MPQHDRETRFDRREGRRPPATENLDAAPPAPAPAADPRPVDIEMSREDAFPQVTRSMRIAALKTDASGCTFTTEGSALHSPLTFKLALTAPNYNAQYSMLLAASLNGCIVEVVGHQLSVATGVHSVDSLELKWTNSSETWETIPNEHR